MPRLQDSRQRILQAALRLFARRGYHGTSITDIITESGCGKGSIFHHFPSKKALGHAVLEEMFRILAEEGAARHLRSTDHPIDALLNMLDELPLAPHLQTGEPLAAGISGRMASVDEDFRRRLAEGFGALIREAEGLVRRGVADGRIVDSVNPEQLTHEVVIAMLGIQSATLLGLPEAICDDARRSAKNYLDSLRR
jgi:TetR/AcrR family transcriptional repressor of nem operon